MLENGANPLLQGKDEREKRKRLAIFTFDNLSEDRASDILDLFKKYEDL